MTKGAGVWRSMPVVSVSFQVFRRLPRAVARDLFSDWKVFLGSAEEEMPISHKIRQYRALLTFAHPAEVPRSTEQSRGSWAQAGNMVGFYAPNSGWLSSWGLGIGLLELSRNPSLVVPWFDVSRLFRVVVPAAILSYPAHPDTWN